jgi:hypothetical protein
MREVNGWFLYDDILEDETRLLNRSKTMTNIVLAYRKNGELEEEGRKTLLEYFSMIPEQERIHCFLGFLNQLQSLGISFNTIQPKEQVH